MTHAGFVYLITNTVTGKAYVGKKFFKAKRNGKIRQSDWRRYYGSSLKLKEDVTALGPDSFRREILEVFETKSEVNYAEVAEQFSRNVLNATMPDGSRAYYNGNIMSRWFEPKGVDSETTRAKRSAASKGRRHSAESKAKISAAQKGRVNRPRTEVEKANLSNKLKGRTRPPLTEEHRLKISLGRTGIKMPEHDCIAKSLRQTGVVRGPYKPQKSISDLMAIVVRKMAKFPDGLTASMIGKFHIQKQTAEIRAEVIQSLVEGGLLVARPANHPRFKSMVVYVTPGDPS